MKDDSDKAREALQRAAKHAKAFDIRSEAMLHDVLYILHNAHQAMFSSYVKIDRDELTELIEEAIDALPKELAEARNMIEERESFLAQREREAQEILDDVRAQAERMVQRSEIVREARRSAQRIVDEANSEANSMRRAVDEYCDKRLAAFEISLDRILRSVREGREKIVSSTMGTDFPKASSTARRDNSSGDKRFVESSMSSRTVADVGVPSDVDVSDISGVSSAGRASSTVNASDISVTPSNAGVSGMPSKPGVPRKNISSSTTDSEVVVVSGSDDMRPNRHGVQPVVEKPAREQPLRGQSAVAQQAGDKQAETQPARERHADTHSAGKSSQIRRDPDTARQIRDSDNGSMDSDEEDDSSRHFFDQDMA